MPEKVTFKGAPCTLAGRRLKTDMRAPDFRVVGNDLKETGLGDFQGKIKVLTSFLSIDTPVCDTQVREFNKEARGFSSDIVILGISKDLPFAQKRFCAMNDIRNAVTLSDYKFSSFGVNYGLLIKEMNLLGRSVIIADKNDVIRYIEIVEELTSPPDYRRALEGLKEVIKNPGVFLEEEFPHRCRPCGEAGALPLEPGEVNRLLAGYRGWQSVEDKKIVKEFKFRDFIEAKYFLDLVSVIAEDQGHHPALTLTYNKLKITLTTHAAGGLTGNDFIMAGIIDEIG